MLRNPYLDCKRPREFSEFTFLFLFFWKNSRIQYIFSLVDLSQHFMVGIYVGCRLEWGRGDGGKRKGEGERVGWGGKREGGGGTGPCGQ